MSIMERGGGIVSTVAATRNSNFIQLRGKAEGFLKQMSVMGVTTVEGKSGYGLDKETELLQLRVMRSLNNDEHKRVGHRFHFSWRDMQCRRSMSGVRTIMWISSFASDARRRSEPVGRVLHVFCEQGVFSIGQSRRLLTAARDMGLR